MTLYNILWRNFRFRVGLLLTTKAKMGQSDSSSCLGCRWRGTRRPEL